MIPSRSEEGGFAPLDEWAAPITDVTDFDAADVQVGVFALDRHGLEWTEILYFIGPIAAFAHAWDLPLEPTASTVASVYSLSDASMGEILDALEDLQAGEPRPPEGEQ